MMEGYQSSAKPIDKIVSMPLCFASYAGSLSSSAMYITPGSGLS
jgi:hypothetical protein